jgi:hypothetical protein
MINTLGRLLLSAAGSFLPSASAQSPATPVLINCRLVIVFDIIATSSGSVYPNSQNQYFPDDFLLATAVSSLHDSYLSVIRDD